MNKNSEQYPKILSDLKLTITKSRLKSSQYIDYQIFVLYQEIGKTIVGQQQSAGWGAKIIEQLVSDLRKEFEDMKGLSVRNLNYMRKLALFYPDF